MTSELIDKEKEIARSWFRELRDSFCKKFEEIDGEKFSRKNWKHSGEGGGEMSTLKGNVFEKVFERPWKCLQTVFKRPYR